MTPELTKLKETVERRFTEALANPDCRRWEACSIVAGCAAVQMAHGEEWMAAAQLEGIAEDARRRKREMLATPLEVAA